MAVEFYAATRSLRKLQVSYSQMVNPREKHKLHKKS